ncbi:hypothetical protein D3C85_1101200 [compost metagenome]
MAAGVDRAAGQRQTVDPGCIPFGPEVGLNLGYAHWLIAAIGRSAALGQFGIEDSHAAEQARTRRDLAKYVQLDTAVALLALHREHSGGQFATGLLDLEQAERGAEGAVVDLHPDFLLPGYVRRKDLARVRGGGWRDIAFAQAFDVVVVERNMIPRLDHDAEQRRGFAFVIGGGDRAGGVEVIRLDVLFAQSEGDLQLLVKHRQGIRQRDAGQLGF